MTSVIKNVKPKPANGMEVTVYVVRDVWTTGEETQLVNLNAITPTVIMIMEIVAIVLVVVSQFG